MDLADSIHFGCRYTGVILGTVLIIAGFPWLEKIHLFHLPADIVIDRPRFKFLLPMLIVSAVLSLLAWLMRRQPDDISRRPGRQEGLFGFSYFIPTAQRALKKIVMVGEGRRTPL
jgi:hypothetical protein